MTDTIKEYFRRFDTGITESLYSAITYEDLQRNKAANQYLDYDRQSLIRKDKQKVYAGVRNIDNSCYLSATLQILYNIQSLRERIFKINQNQATKFIKQLQRIFALMLKGSLVYVDPTKIFNSLKQAHPQVFIQGVQNDFHEVYTLILDELEKGLTTEEDKRFFKKMFYGRMRSQISDLDNKKVINNGNQAGNSFNLINLSSESKNFETALKKFKHEEIQGFVGENGVKINAVRDTIFLQTPAMMGFFINRVTYNNNKLNKDSSEFQFQQKIQFSKSGNGKLNNKNSDAQIQKQINLLTQWIQKISIQKQSLVKVATYFQQSKKQFTDLHIPVISNPSGQNAKTTCHKYLQTEIEQIDLTIKKTQQEISELQNKRIKQAQDNYIQLYSLFAVMIHYGSRAESGHYKICIKPDTQSNKWIQFNDRKTEQISFNKILEYKRKGQVCCVFYRRATLQNITQKSTITHGLKKYVQDQQSQIFHKIDNARILQSLYQQYETINSMWDHFNLRIRQQEQVSTYFFQSVLHLIKTSTPSQVCKGFMLYETIKNSKFIQNLKEKLIDPSRELIIPEIDFGIPQEYFQISTTIKEFLIEENLDPINAYENISFFMDLTIQNQTVRKYFNIIKQIIYLKGIFYQALFVQKKLLPTYDSFAKSMDKIMNTFNDQDPIIIVTSPVRTKIHENYLNKIIENDDIPTCTLKRQLSISEAKLRDSGNILFYKRFGKWFEQRKRLNVFSTDVLKEYCHLYSSYVNEIQYG